MPTPEPRSALAGIVDIEPPPAPPAGAGGELLLAGIGLLFLVMAGYLIWRWRTSPRHRSLRRLARLRRRHEHGRIDDRAAAFALAQILRQRLGVTHLTPALRSVQDESPTAGQKTTGDPPHWPAFLDALSTARYAPAPPSRETLRALFAAATRYCREGRCREGRP